MQMVRKAVRNVGGLAVLVALAQPVAAQGWIEPVRADGGVVKVRSAVTARVSGRIAIVEVEESFRNDGPVLAEGHYLYPLPGEASFGDFTLFMGDQALRGETMDADRARGIYEEIVRRQRDPALIELAGHGLLRARVFPIEPGQTRRIILRYTQLLDAAGDALVFRYAAPRAGAQMAPMPMPQPMPVPRPGRLDDAVREAPGERTTDRRPGWAATSSFRLIVPADAGIRTAFSPTHEVDVERDDGALTVRPRGEVRGDLSIFLMRDRRDVGLSLATYRPSGEDGYFMLTLSPGEVRVAAAPRDVTVVVDVSGSMSGEKIEQARGALRQLLETLDGGDRFRLIRFSSDVRAYEAGWVEATPAARASARGWIEDLRAEGGTNIDGALAEALRVEPGAGRLPIVVFLTDGLPSVGEQNPERIAAAVERRRGSTRIFAFGVGYDVNTLLLDRLGAAGRGGAQYVSPDEDVELAVGMLATRIRHPVLTDLELGGSPVRLSEIHPRTLPDLFAGEELVILGRYAGSGSGELTVRGRRSGAVERYGAEVIFPAHTDRHEYIARLWASRKVGALGQQLRLNPSDELREELRATALRYGLLTEYTSYLVLEPGADVAQMPAAPPPSGRAAVETAQRSRALRAAANATALEEVQVTAGAVAMQEAAADADGSAKHARVISGRRFVQDGDGWLDSAQRDQRTVTVRPFSDAYFELARRLPELRMVWRELDRVTVAGARGSIRLAEDGAAQLSDAELERIVREFRAR